MFRSWDSFKHYSTHELKTPKLYIDKMKYHEAIPICLIKKGWSLIGKASNNNNNNNNNKNDSNNNNKNNNNNNNNNNKTSAPALFTLDRWVPYLLGKRSKSQGYINQSFPFLLIKQHLYRPQNQTSCKL